MNTEMYWPKTEDVPPPPEPSSGLKELKRVDIAFPAHVNPDPNDVPEQYWSDKNSDGEGYWHENPNHPWVKFASYVMHNRGKGMALLPREGTNAQKAWEWADACLRSYELKHEQKLAVVAWILESNFWAYWFKDSVPPWVELPEESA